MYSSLTDKDTDAGSENVRDQVSAEFGNSTRHPDSYSGHLPTLLCNDLEYMFPESTLKIFPGACSSLPVTVIKKKKSCQKATLGRKGLGVLFYLMCLFYHWWKPGQELEFGTWSGDHRLTLLTILLPLTCSFYTVQAHLPRNGTAYNGLGARDQLRHSHRPMHFLSWWPLFLGDSLSSLPKLLLVWIFHHSNRNETGMGTFVGS